MELRVHNHYTGKKEPFRPGDAERVTMYVCGMTVQGKPHMGHMLAFVSADLIRRCLEYMGYNVLHVQNFTDIDDKIIVRAKEEGRSAAEVAQENIDAYMHAAELLNIRPAHLFPKVTEHIPEIVAYIERLIEKGHAYPSEGNVYFDVRSYARYGELSGRKLDELQVAVREGIEVDASKREAFDFALWKAAKEAEPAWESPWGRGRPGWHIECSAMSTKYLGATFDFHGGGRDLIFPHHENEMAQSRALEGEFVRYWMHNGLLNLEGQKMSKSTGHFFGVEEVLAEYDPDVARFYLLQGHFRNQMEYGRERLDEAKAAHGRMKRAIAHLEELCASNDLGAEIPDGVTGEAGVELEERAARALVSFQSALSDDFNAGAAIGGFFELIREANLYFEGRERARMDAAAVRRVLAVLREGFDVLGLFADVGAVTELPPEIAEMVRRRDGARADRDWAQADALRDEMLSRGWRVEDTPQGTKVAPD
jgi:cysteinyl-tRNA synthetase